MEKYEFNLRVDQIKKLVSKGNYAEAIKLADTIDWHRMRNPNLLAMIAQVYEENGEFEEAREILLHARERSPASKRILFHLTELALKQGNQREARGYCKEFREAAPGDPRQELLRYQILKAEDVPAEKLIPVLESYVSTEMDERWMYELAELYSRAGQGDKCVELCDRIMLMFGLGKYVDKAMQLKLRYAPLNEYQSDLAQNRGKYEAKLKAVEEEFSKGPLDMLLNGEDGRDPEEELAANLQQAETEENLAQEVSRIARDGYGESAMIDEPTKPLYAIRRSARTETAAGSRAEQGVRAEERREEERRAEERRAEERRAEEEPPVREPQAFAQEAAPYHLAVEARTPEKGLQAAIRLLKEYHLANDLHNPTLKITGDKLNSRGVLNVADRLRGKDLIIEEAGDLSDEEVGNLSELMAEDTSGMIVVLVDNPRQMEELYQKNPEFLQMFEHVDAERAGGEAAREALRVQAEEPADGRKESGTRGETEEAAAGSGTVIFEEETDGGDARAEAGPGNPGYSKDAGDAKDEGAAGPAPRAGAGEPEGGAEPAGEAEEPEAGDYAGGPDDTAEAEDYAGGPDDAAEAGDYAGVAEDAAEAEDYAGIADEPAEAEDYAGVADDTAEAGDEGDAEYGEPEDDSYDEEMDADAFAEYACHYAEQIDCSILGKSMLALYERVELMEEDGIPLTKANAKELIEEAADKAERPSLGRLITGVFSHKYDKNGLLILREEHFI